ncbi:DUF1330 domain-containing protein [Reichenbachiella sp. MSK19-1]|uniref:DUF1330 domain-containing protein n=1 Tax=Reichenbachiella sp. MSK19-1 TaxID=1897631 RepID=UPI000E6D2260|nr:DUF1330 domain-containing protein [Reichenbachiella sp. MSK19-1]RJE71679.1 DUF1330 domain-containing protein [Reichenbachiella sp. MSK19-1]
MIYITQLIYIKAGKEQEFENHVIPLMEKYTGKIIQRIRPTVESFVSGEENQPYEIHFLSFDSQEKLDEYLRDDSRLQYIHLKEASIQSTFLVKGTKI